MLSEWPILKQDHAVEYAACFIAYLRFFGWIPYELGDRTSRNSDWMSFNWDPFMDEACLRYSGGLASYASFLFSFDPEGEKLCHSNYVA